MMSAKTDIKVGDILYLPKVGGSRVRPLLLDIDEYQVRRVGKKYIYLGFKDWRSEIRVGKESLCYENPNYSQNNQQYYLDKQGIYDLYEQRFLFNGIRDVFNTNEYNYQKEFPLDQLREIAKILNITYLQPIHLNAEKETAV